jgi:hypothetical protein
MKAYIEVPVEKEPEYHDLYHTDCGIINFDEDGWSGKIDDYWETFSPKYYLKPLPLEELMVEQLDWIDKNYFKVDQNAYVLKYSNLPFGEAKRLTYKDLTNEYLKSKGIQK